MLLQHNQNTSKVSLCLPSGLRSPLISCMWKDLLQSLDTLVRVVSIRLQVDCKSISNLLIATVGLHRNQPPDSLSIISTIIPLFFEILSEGLLLKIRLRVTTLQSILEVRLIKCLLICDIRWPDTLQALMNAQISPGVTPTTLHPQLFVGLVEGGCYWLDHHVWTEGQTEQDFDASLAVARMIFQAMSYDALILQRMSGSNEVSKLIPPPIPDTSVYSVEWAFTTAQYAGMEYLSHHCTCRWSRWVVGYPALQATQGVFGDIFQCTLVICQVRWTGIRCSIGRYQPSWCSDQAMVGACEEIWKLLSTERTSVRYRLEWTLAPIWSYYQRTWDGSTRRCIVREFSNFWLLDGLFMDSTRLCQGS